MIKGNCANCHHCYLSHNSEGKCQQLISAKLGGDGSGQLFNTSNICPCLHYLGEGNTNVISHSLRNIIDEDMKIAQKQLNSEIYKIPEPIEMKIDEEWDYLEVYSQRYQRSEVYAVSQGSWKPKFSILTKDSQSKVDSFEIQHLTSKVITDEVHKAELKSLLERWEFEGAEDLVNSLEQIDDDNGFTSIYDAFDKSITVTESFIVPVSECKFFKTSSGLGFRGFQWIIDSDVPKDKVYAIDINKIPYTQVIRGFDFKIDNSPGLYKGMTLNSFQSEPKTTLEAIKKMIERIEKPNPSIFDNRTDL